MHYKYKAHVGHAIAIVLSNHTVPNFLPDPGVLTVGARVGE